MKKSKNLFACFTDVHAIVAMALFIALSVLIGKLPAFNLTPTIRFSIENLPIFVAWNGLTIYYLNIAPYKR